MPGTPVFCEVATPVGVARTVSQTPSGSVGGLLVLGHGAGGGIEAPDLLAARDAGLAAGLRVIRVEQPWRVRGRRIAEAPARLDLAWLAVLEQCRGDGPLILGGRSAGARVACRTATALGADAVLALAFPLHPLAGGVSRWAELRGPAVPRLVVQGERDAFGVPAQEPGVQVYVVTGADHAFAVRRKDGRTPEQVATDIREAVRGWLVGLQTLT